MQECECGCGADISGWSNAAKARGLRRRIRRIYRPSHGTCYYCGLPLDQFQECAECSGEDLTSEPVRGYSSVTTEEKPNLVSPEPKPHDPLGPPEDCRQRKITIGKTVKQTPDGSLIEYECSNHDEVTSGQWQLKSQENTSDNQTCFTYVTHDGFVKEYRDKEGSILSQKFLNRECEPWDGFKGWAEKTWWENGRIRERSKVWPNQSDEEWQTLTELAKKRGGGLFISERYDYDGNKSLELSYVIDDSDGQLYEYLASFDQERALACFESRDRQGILCSSENMLTYFESSGEESWVKRYMINKDGESVYHRTDGPAIFYGYKTEDTCARYFLEGKEYSKTEWEKKVGWTQPERA